MIGVIAVCDVERLEDLEKSKQEVLREKEKMKYGAVSSRKKDLWYRQIAPSPSLSSSSFPSPSSSSSIISTEGKIIGESVSITSSSVSSSLFSSPSSPSSSSSSSSKDINQNCPPEKIILSENMRDTSLRQKAQININQPSEATQTLSRAVASLLYSLSSLGVDFLQLPEDGQKSIWRGIETFGKGKKEIILY